MIFLLFALLGVGADLAHDVSTTFEVEQQCEMEKDSSPENESEEKNKQEKEQTNTLAFPDPSDSDRKHDDNFTFVKYGADHIEGVPSPPPDFV